MRNQGTFCLQSCGNSCVRSRVWPGVCRSSVVPESTANISAGFFLLPFFNDKRHRCDHCCSSFLQEQASEAAGASADVLLRFLKNKKIPRECPRTETCGSGRVSSGTSGGAGRELLLPWQLDGAGWQLDGALPAAQLPGGSAPVPSAAGGREKGGGCWQHFGHQRLRGSPELSCLVCPSLDH